MAECKLPSSIESFDLPECVGSTWWTEAEGTAWFGTCRLGMYGGQVDLSRLTFDCSALGEGDLQEGDLGLDDCVLW